MDRSVITVFGGNGFIGRVLVRQLVAQGYQVRVTSRAPHKAAWLVTQGTTEEGKASILPVYASVTEPDSVRSALNGATAAINLVSILSEKRGTTFKEINAQAPGVVARVARECGVQRLVQVSAIGASTDAPSHYGRSKAEGEERVRSAFAGAVILRPSVVFGPGDSFLTMFALMARALPVLPVYHPDTHLQPVFVDDVAQAATRCLTDGGLTGSTYELGGPDKLTMREVMAFVARSVGRNPRLLPVPGWLAGIQAGVFERLPGKLLTRDQLAMLSRDNLVTAGAKTLEALGVDARRMYDVAPEYLSQVSLLRTLRK